MQSLLSSLWKNRLHQGNKKAISARERRARLSIEALEKRDCPAYIDLRGTAVVIDGSNGDDTGNIWIGDRGTATPYDDVAVVNLWHDAGYIQKVYNLWTPTYAGFSLVWYRNVTNVTFQGNAGNDRFDNYTGFDSVLDGAWGNDTLNGGWGNDKLLGWDDNDVLSGGGGNDSLYGEYGDDTLYGGTGNDMLYGGYGNDSLYGGYGNDRLYGESGADSLYGDDGNDYLDGGGSYDWATGAVVGDGYADKLYGGLGADTFVYYSSGSFFDPGDTWGDFNWYEGDTYVWHRW